MYVFLTCRYKGAPLSLDAKDVPKASGKSCCFSMDLSPTLDNTALHNMQYFFCFFLQPGLIKELFDLIHTLSCYKIKIPVAFLQAQALCLSFVPCLCSARVSPIL